MIVVLNDYELTAEDICSCYNGEKAGTARMIGKVIQEIFKMKK